ncbi:ABC transporter ATP-binding protein [Alcanivorax sp. 24]|uniref:ABC transporter ATP-binding protein n=1 Tax=Alcanivorax sp. 24 TaxID=2545266 RepID=UPI00105C4439|nr:ABC transporter ATP-binding protein [Alcanivorax sp. 24]
MISDLLKILGPKHAGDLRRYLLWLGAYGVLQGVATAFLVPVLAAMIHGDGQRAAYGLLALALTVLLVAVAHYRQAMKGFSLALVVLTTLHDRLGAKLVSLPLGWFSSERVGRLSRSATGGTMMVTNVFAHLLTPVVTGVLTPATTALTLLFFDWRLGLTVLLAAPFIYVLHHWSASWIARTEQRVDAAGVEASNRVVEFARLQPVLRAFGRTREGYPPLDQAIDAQQRAGGDRLSATFPRLLMAGLSVHLAFAALLVVGVMLALAHAIDTVELVALLALSARLAGPLAEAAARSGQLRMAANDLRRLADIFDQPPLPEPARSLPISDPGTVCLSNVVFGYRPEQPIIDGVSLRVPAGSMTAIIGPSGSGKTTLTWLIMRFHDVDSGAVQVGGADVRGLTSADLMAQIAPVMQDVYLFDDTLEANIRIGAPGASDQDVHEAARLAGVDEIVKRLPQGWRSPVGEGGGALSGGERQRISLARALLKKAPIVILDEATAALDAENERHVQNALRTLRARSTLIVVAHQLSTIRSADQIVMLEHGAVVATGTHPQLSTNEPRYAEFWRERQRARGWRLTDVETSA